MNRESKNIYLADGSLWVSRSQKARDFDQIHNNHTNYNTIGGSNFLVPIVTIPVAILFVVFNWGTIIKPFKSLNFFESNPKKELNIKSPFDQKGNHFPYIDPKNSPKNRVLFEHTIENDSDNSPEAKIRSIHESSKIFNDSEICLNKDEIAITNTLGQYGFKRTISTKGLEITYEDKDGNIYGLQLKEKNNLPKSPNHTLCLSRYSTKYIYDGPELQIEVSSISGVKIFIKVA